MLIDLTRTSPELRTEPLPLFLRVIASEPYDDALRKIVLGSKRAAAGRVDDDFRGADEIDAAALAACRVEVDDGVPFDVYFGAVEVSAATLSVSLRSAVPPSRYSPPPLSASLPLKLLLLMSRKPPN